MTEVKAIYRFNHSRAVRTRRILTRPGSSPRTPGVRQYERVHDRARIFDWIVAYKTANDGNSPAITDICTAFQIGSKSVVKTILEGMEDEGLIHLSGNRKARSIRVIGGRWSFDNSTPGNGV